MIDREKVIKGLECCMKWTGEPNTATCHCSDCSYTNMDILGQRCLIDLINDALAMLKEQQQQIWELQDQEEFLTDKLKEQDATDIREIVGLWCDDITFCQEECGWMSCPRNKRNIRDKTVPHSFSVEIPEDCPKRQEGR